jgi:4-hydroxy-3-polyprenylbenzoate decarboxylase
MMFNKIMVVTDQSNPWIDMETFARNISDKIDPLTDIIFSSGPMDVLDHSSSKFAFGSKMGIDATAKYPEEMDGPVLKITQPDYREFHNLLSEIPVVKSVNASLLGKGISVLILGIEKKGDFHLTEVSELLLKSEAIRKVKFIVLVDADLPVDNLEDVVWYVTGNIDPKRDCHLFKAIHPLDPSQMVIDGTRKTAQADGFRREWPNPVLSSRDTINKVDEIWSALGLGELIQSPSLIYYPLKRGEGAVSD